MTYERHVEAIRSGLERSGFDLAVDRLHLRDYEDIA